MIKNDSSQEINVLTCEVKRGRPTKCKPTIGIGQPNVRPTQESYDLS